MLHFFIFNISFFHQFCHKKIYMRNVWALAQKHHVHSSPFTIIHMQPETRNIWTDLLTFLYNIYFYFCIFIDGICFVIENRLCACTANEQTTRHIFIHIYFALKIIIWWKRWNEKFVHFKWIQMLSRFGDS